MEDTDYFNEESANHIRAIAANGYWGTVNTDESGSPVTGSLEAVKKMMENAKDADGNPVFTEDQINNLTEGEALAATQMAIWKYGNPYQGEDKNIYLDADTLDYNNYQGKSAWYEGDSTNELYEQGVNSPEKITAALGRIDALANYLMSLSMTKEDAEKAGLGETEVIGETNFISDMSLTVIDKVADHENNADKISDNDAYNVNLTFALVVTPGENDDLIVKVIDGNNNVVSTARIAGDGTNDEGFSQITTTTDADGKTNYILSGLKLIENSDTTFNLKLEGAQYLEQGVYVYSSQIQDYDLDKDGVIEDRNSDGECEKNVSSQTFVGIAEGYKSVDVSMEVNLNFNVVDSTITTTREWRTEHDPVNKDTQPEPTPETPEEKPTPTTPPTPEQPKTEPNVQDIPDEDVPLTDIPDEDVPLAAVPQTGDMSPLWMLMSAVSGIGLAGTVVLRKKDEE